MMILVKSCFSKRRLIRNIYSFRKRVVTFILFLLCGSFLQHVPSFFRHCFNNRCIRALQPAIFHIKQNIEFQQKLQRNHTIISKPVGCSEHVLILLDVPMDCAIAKSKALVKSFIERFNELDTGIFFFHYSTNRVLSRKVGMNNPEKL